MVSAALRSVAASPSGRTIAKPLSRAITALALGLLVGFAVLGGRPINPFDTSWISGDAAMSQTGFAFMRRAPLLVFPLTWSPALGYPVGVSTAYLDNIPLAALVGKLLGIGFGPGLQILGPFFVFCAALQFHYGRRLSERLLGGGVRAVVGGAFFLLAPPFIWRASGHFALCAQFLILAALCELIPPPGARPLRRAWVLPTISFVAASIHPYLMLMVLGIAGAATARPMLDARRKPAQPTSDARRALVRLRAEDLPGNERPMLDVHRAGTWRAAIIFATCLASALAGALLFGFIVPGAGGELSAGGWTAYSMDLLAPIDPQSYPSLLFRPHPIGPGQYEGYNYLGAGMVAVVLVAFCRIATGALRLPRELPLRLLLAMIAAMALFAASTRMTAGGHVLIDVPLPDRLRDILSAIRGSGRFFWPGYYAIFCLALAGARAPGWRPAALLAAALMLQAADTASLRQAIRAQWHGKAPADILRDPVWRDLPRRYAHLSLVPSHVCDDDAGPGGAAMEPVFSRYAALSGLTLDSFRAARDDTRLIAAFCDVGAPFAAHGLDADTAYVLTPGMLPTLLALAQRHALTGEHCGLADGFILCVSRPGVPGSGATGLSASGPGTTSRITPGLGPPGLLTNSPDTASAGATGGGETSGSEAGWSAPGLDPGLEERFLPPLAAGTVDIGQINSTSGLVFLSFEAPSGEGIRTRGHASVLAFRLAAPWQAGTPVALQAAPALPGKAATQRVRVRAAGRLLLDGVVSAGHGTLAFRVPPEAVSPGGIVSLSLDLPDAMSPRDAGVNVDTRLFAVTLQTLTIGP